MIVYITADHSSYRDFGLAAPVILTYCNGYMVAKDPVTKCSQAALFPRAPLGITDQKGKDVGGDLIFKGVIL